MNDVECAFVEEIVEFHCGRLQGLTKAQAQEIAAQEGITYTEFRKQGGAEVSTNNSFVLK